MKEKDIVDFEKMEKDGDRYIDENGNEVGCKICYTHEKAYEKFQKEKPLIVEARRYCPNCGEEMNDNCDSHVVSETNYSNPEGEIGYYHILECDHCGQVYALMPIPISYNGNHDIYYTGGRDYIKYPDLIKLKDDIFKKIEPSIIQYIERKLNPKNDVDRRLNLWNIKIWSEGDVEHAIANWFYEHRLKK